MSVRAYKVIEIKKGAEMFNNWQDLTLKKFLEGKGTNQLNNDGCGFWEFHKDELQEALEEATEKAKTMPDTGSCATFKAVFDQLNTMITECNKDGYLLLSLF